MHTPRQSDGAGPIGPVLPLAALAAGLVAFAVLQIWALVKSHHGFEYPLDDPYIHLAIADVITKGGYGVNLGEFSSPGSSALYPLLLTPFAGSEVQRYLPLLWNIVGLGALSWLWGRLLAETGYMRDGWRGLGLAAAVIGPVALMMPHVAMTGMEHSLHAAVTLVIVLGLIRHLKGQGGLAFVITGAFLAVSLRFEAAALGLLAAGFLASTASWRGGFATLAATLLPLAAFVGTLMALGLDPLPSSISAKLALVEAEGGGPFTHRLAVLGRNLMEPGGLLLLALSVALFLVARLARDLTRDWRLFGMVVAGAGFAHILFGQIGWLDRYEHYVLVAAAAAVLALIPQMAGSLPGRGAIGGVAALLLAGLVAYQPGGTTILPDSARAIGAQQGEMARFAQEFLKAPVAVNDLGKVAWRNPEYVLDLWGLANPAAREAMHAAEGASGWAGPITAASGVPVAMIYDNWIEEGVGAEWVRIGRLSVTETGGFLGGYIVSFYATAPEHVPAMTEALVAWEATLGDGTVFVFDEGMDP